MLGSPDINFPAQADPANLAAQQGQNNLQAAIATSLLNQTNEVTPFGTVSFTQNQPAGGVQPQIQGQPVPFGGITDQTILAGARGGRTGGIRAPQQGGVSIAGFDVPQFTRTVTLAPEQQAQLDAQNRLSAQLSGLAESNVGRVQQAQAGGFDVSNLPQAVSGINAAPISGFQPLGGQVQSTLRQFDPLAGIDTSFLQGAQVQGAQGVDVGGLQGVSPLGGQGIDVAGLQGVGPTGAQGIDTAGLFGLRPDFAQQGAELERATFERGRSLLEPQFSRQQELAEIRLSERGLPLSSQAGGDILGGVQLGRNRALNELALSSVAAGRQEQGRLAQLAQSQRAQQFGERQATSEAANRAAQQQFGQQFGLRGQQFGERATQQQAVQQAAQQQFGQQIGLRGQQFGERATQADIANQAAQQRFAQQTGLRGQQFGEQLGRGQFANQAAAQAFTQGLAGGEFGNAARQQALAEALAGQQAGNVAQQQSFQQAAQNELLAC